jgi:5-methylcytosine-specific restriction protein A
MDEFVPGRTYSRKDVWARVNSDLAFPNGGGWLTGYVEQDKKLFAFINIGTPGKTGHMFPNKYEEDENLLTWFGKPNSHSAQPTFKRLLQGETILFPFVRWDNKNTDFTYLGRPKVRTIADNFSLKDGTTTIKIELEIQEAFVFPALDPLAAVADSRFGIKKEVIINRYERNPRYREECLAHFGPICKICGFDFHLVYGELGRGYCHVHHIEPLSEVGGEKNLNPITDLLPVCANCHTMLHQRIPALLPHELRKILMDQKSR